MVGTASEPKRWRRPRRAPRAGDPRPPARLYGRPVNDPHGHPIAELVRTVLSQNTNDRNRDVAYERLRAALPTWVEVRDAPVAVVEEAIRPGGLSQTKAPRIQEILRRLPESDGEPTLDWLADTDREEALDFLTGLPGVGRKTAACVLIFTFDRPEIPVDTHVYRVGGRLGLFPERASFEAAHDEMLAITDPEDAYELHMNLIPTAGASAGPSRAARSASCGGCVRGSGGTGRNGRFPAVSKRPFVLFGLLAALCLLVIPFFALGKEGDQDAALVKVEPQDQRPRSCSPTTAAPATRSRPQAPTASSAPISTTCW